MVLSFNCFRRLLLVLAFLAGTGGAVCPGAQRRYPDNPGPLPETVLTLKTNILAIPLTNVGIEIPLSDHWSLGADWYSPWMWRPRQRDGIDTRGWCFQFQAVDAEVRYWFGRKGGARQRLTGHSIGLYGALGHYDFEWDYSGSQGHFYNAGLDYKYALPIFHDVLRLEFELGVGYIWSVAQPYDCFSPGEYCYKRIGVQKYIRWWGPTRAQVSLVFPIRVYNRAKPKKGGK